MRNLVKLIFMLILMMGLVGTGIVNAKQTTAINTDEGFDIYRYVQNDAVL